MAKTEQELIEVYQEYQKLQEARLVHKKVVENTFLPGSPEALPFAEQEAFFKDVSKQILLRCGNRAAKTFSNIRHLAWVLMRNHPYQLRYNAKQMGITYEDTKPLNVWVCAPTFDFIMDTILMKYLFAMIPQWYYTDDSGNEMITYHAVAEKPIKSIRFRNGDVIQTRSYSQDLTTSMGRVIDLIILDEMPANRMIISEFVTRTFDCDGTIICGFTPLVENVEIKDYLDDKCKTGAMNLHSWSLTSNPHYRDNPERLRTVMMEWDSLPLAERSARLNGDWYFESRHGKAFSDCNIEIVPSFPVPKHWRRARVVDPAAHKTGVTFFAEDPDTNNWYAYLSTEIGKSTNGIDAKTIYAEITRIEPHEDFVLSIYDNSELWFGSEAVVREHFRPCIQKNVNAAVMATKGVFNSGRLKLFDTCKGAVNQFQDIEWGPDGKLKNKSKYHMLDTIMYFCREVPPKAKTKPTPAAPETDQGRALKATLDKIKCVKVEDKKPHRTYRVGRKTLRRSRR
jgi:hypothetical protein